MATDNTPEFSSEAIGHALDTARTYSESARATAESASTGQEIGLDDGTLQISAQCISLAVQNGQVCINLPFGLGKKCLPIPKFVPNGTLVEACLDICTKWGIPCGVKVTISLAGKPIVKKGFGCSC